MIHASLDTSKDFVLAIEQDGRLLLNAHQDGTGRDSDRLLADWLKNAFAQCGLSINDATHWSVGTGPGSFAGLRCGIAMLKGICLGSGALLRGVPSVYALARAAQDAAPQAASIGVLNDGRCGQVIASRYEIRDGRPVPAADPVPAFPAELLDGAPCDVWISNQASLLPELPGAVSEKLIAVERVNAAFLLENTDGFAWPQNAMEREVSTAPIYVRQAVFVRPAELRSL